MLSLFVVLAVLLEARVWITRDGTVGGLQGDPELFMWYLRWAPWAVLHGQDPFITHHLIAPTGANLLWNTSIIGPSLVMSPVTAVVGPQWSYDVLMTAAPALSGFVAHLALRRHASVRGSLAGGVLYGFSPALTAQSLGHPMISIAVFPPLAMLLIEDVVTAGSRRRRLTRGALLGAAAAVQLLTGTEMLALTVIAAALGVAVLAALHPTVARARLRGVAEGFGAAAVVGLALAAVPLVVLLAGPDHVGATLQVPDVYVQDLANLGVPGPFQAVAPGAAVDISAHATGNAVEVSGYLGIPLLLLLAATAALLWRRHPAAALVRWATLTAVAIVVLSLGPHLHVDGHVLHLPLPWRLAAGRPLLDSLLPSRFMVIAYLPLAALVAAAVDVMLRRSGPGARVVTLIATAAVAVSLLPRPLPAYTPSVAGFFSGPAVERIPEGSTVLLSAGGRGGDAMLDQAVSGMRFRMTDGAVFIPGPHFGPPPGPLEDELAAAEGPDAWALPDAVRQQALRVDLDALHLSAVVVAPQPQRARVEGLIAALLGVPAEQIDGVALWILPAG